MSCTCTCMSYVISKLICIKAYFYSECLRVGVDFVRHVELEPLLYVEHWVRVLRVRTAHDCWFYWWAEPEEASSVSQTLELSNHFYACMLPRHSSQYIHANTSRYYYSRSATVMHFYSMLLLYYWYWYSVRTGVRIYYRVPYESIPD